MERTPRVYRVPRGQGGVVYGLCAGIGAHLGIDPMVIRFALALLVFVPMSGLIVVLLYMLFAVNTPVQPS
jgi:phage shock protein PspC (stress-responsive transcriptional regulator)